MTATRTERASLVLLCASVFLVFAFGARNLGFYYEDSGFITALTSANLSKFWELFAHGSVPGRNLYVVWQGLLYKLVGNPAAHLTILHLIQSALDAAIVATFYVTLRRLGASAAASFLAAGLFAFWPLHGETHYWTPGTPYNLSTLFLLLFILTSLRLLQRPGAPWGIWVLDAIVFGCALYTYDQLVIVIAMLLAGRLLTLMVRSPGQATRIVARHSFNLALCALYFVQKVTAPAGQSPTLTKQTLANLWPNIHQIFRQNFGSAWSETVRPLYEQATVSDVWIAFLAAAIVMAASIGAMSQIAVIPKRAIKLFLAGLAFFVLTYLPVTLWFVSPRHHFLPSIGLFACVAALTDLFFFVARTPLVRVLPVAAAGLGVVFFAQASRGEGRDWERSFAAKRQLYADLTPEIRGKEILLLQEFPVLLGPAEVILPLDARFGPMLVYKPEDIASFRTGDVGGSPAHHGVFLHTLARFYATDSISYYGTDRALIVTFLKWLDDDRFSYRVNLPADNPPYQILDATAIEYDGPFAVESAAIAPAGNGAVLSVDVRSAVPANSHLAMTISVQGSAGLEDWGRKTVDGFLNRTPVLLESGIETLQHGVRFEGRILLSSFPDSSNVHLHFLAVNEDGVTGHLGEWDLTPAASRQ